MTIIEQYKNKIINADCMDILKALPDKSIDLVLTDPPYKQEFHGRGMAKHRPNYIKICNYGSAKNIDYTEFFSLCLKKLKTINLFIFCDKETKFDFIKMAKEKGFGYREIPFCKTAPTPFTNNQWLNDVEWGLHIFKNAKVYGDYSTKRGWFIMPNFQEPNVNHPTQKRIDIIINILKNISNNDDIVFDGFSGSGTTAIACYNLKRNFICIEKNFDYFTKSIERLNNVKAQLKLF